ncbi:MAG: hypothetical protein KIT11_05395 [Fimbriimonadaceae bacterium]|nr:hypothetical protein [Fimbriimonadaceae bacterium]QYK56673.1 MAG: hypothetical protein KF733_04125 [Fimbriimonadaceae bacterium]
MGELPWWAEVVLVAKYLHAMPADVLSMRADHYQWVLAVVNAEQHSQAERARQAGGR